MVPRALAEDLARSTCAAPHISAPLALDARANRRTIEGLYLSPISRAAQDHTVGVVREIAERYPIDGIHLDYVRYPNEEFDYSRDSLAAFRQNVLPDSTPVDRRRTRRGSRRSRSSTRSRFRSGGAPSEPAA